MRVEIAGGRVVDEIPAEIAQAVTPGKMSYDPNALPQTINFFDPRGISLLDNRASSKDPNPLPEHVSFRVSKVSLTLTCPKKEAYKWARVLALSRMMIQLEDRVYAEFIPRMESCVFMNGGSFVVLNYAFLFEPGRALHVGSGIRYKATLHFLGALPIMGSDAVLKLALDGVKQRPVV